MRIAGEVVLYLLALRGLMAVVGVPPIMEWFRREPMVDGFNPCAGCGCKTSDACRVREEARGNGPGARARAALALFDRKEQTP